MFSSSLQAESENIAKAARSMGFKNEIFIDVFVFRCFFKPLAELPFTKFVKILEMCKQFSENLVNESGNVPRRGPVPKSSDLEVWRYP